jgi:acetyl esterase/lipase
MILRDENLPMPSGASLISPWVDLTHSFPSITIPTEYDYVPSHGFHAKPNLSWPPPNTDELRALGQGNPNQEPDFEVEIDGQSVVLKEQFQMYAANLHLQIPLVSPILAASLGGFCPVQVISGGGEVLRDEQIYLAHKMANPDRYFPCEQILERNGQSIQNVYKYPPTDVQLLSFDDAGHAMPTLGHTNIAKHQYRAISQFAAWALANAQQRDIDIDDTKSQNSVNLTDSRINSVDIVRSSSHAGYALVSAADNLIALRLQES